MNTEIIFGQKYKGPVYALHGKTAMLRLNKYNGGVLAQFDDRSLGTWAHTWEWFPSEHFEITGVTRDNDGKLYAVDHFEDVPYTVTGRASKWPRPEPMLKMANGFDDLGKAFKRTGETVEKFFVHADLAELEARVLASDYRDVAGQWTINAPRSVRQ